jgi:D-3-phosphoglycerate dehydrogenase
LSNGIIRNAVNMPSIDSAALKVLGPYLDLGAKLGTLVQQIAPARIESLQITYWGKIIDLDANAVTRAIQRGWLRKISGEDVNEVNAPYLLKRLGVEVEVTKSNSDVDYTELISVKAIDCDGNEHKARGTLIGKSQQPRIVGINGREVEVVADGKLLVLENLDLPGMVGEIGTLLGRTGVNIADMSLSRLVPGETAYMVVGVDSEPTNEARAEIKDHPKIKLAKFVQL